MQFSKLPWNVDVQIFHFFVHFLVHSALKVEAYSSIFTSGTAVDESAQGPFIVPFELQQLVALLIYRQKMNWLLFWKPINH